MDYPTRADTWQIVPTVMTPTVMMLALAVAAVSATAAEAPVTASAAAAEPAVIATPVRIDHVILGIADLDRGIAEMARRTGIRAVPGGSHPGRGTHNALMSLGPGIYLEIIAPDPAQKTPPQGFDMLAGLQNLTPIGWAVATDDAPALRSDLAGLGYRPSAPRPGSRSLPGGVTLEWVSFDIDNAPDLAPFFIAWGQRAKHPSTTSPGGCRLGSLGLTSPDKARLAAIVDRLGLGVRVGAGQHDAEALTLVCPGGDVRFE